MTPEMCIFVFILVILAWGWMLGRNVERSKVIIPEPWNREARLAGWEGYKEEE